MAHHVGPEPLPRAHRPRAPMMSVAAPTIAPLVPLRPPPPVTLTAPRPEAERAINEYVENPFPSNNNNHHQTTPRLTNHDSLRLPLTNTNHPHNHERRPPPPIPSAITTAPTPISFRKSPPECGTTRSIMCSDCGRCRCQDCQQPKRLPSCWLCNNNCLCSAETAVDYGSCLCCVKGVYYHYSNSDSGETSCADDPCGCGPDRRVARWGCLAVLSVVLPCLWLYWPLQGCKRTVEACYSRYSSHGCTCRPPLNTPEKRLLDSSPDF